MLNLVPCVAHIHRFVFVWITSVRSINSTQDLAKRPQK